MPIPFAPPIETRTGQEWLEADAYGGFAMGTAGLVRTRRYHALLCPALTPPTGRVVLVNDVEVWLRWRGQTRALSAHRYRGGVLHPRGDTHVVDFEAHPWPRWTFACGDGARLVHDRLVVRASGETVLRWRFDGDDEAALEVRPLLSGRDYHALHRENGAFDFTTHGRGPSYGWRPYPSLPMVTALTSGAGFEAHATWFRNFHYAQEEARGLDFEEDLGSPGVLRFRLRAGRDAWMILRVGDAPIGDARELGPHLMEVERARRATFGDDRLRQSAEAYVVRRGDGRSIIAGYPWFTDWGRDTFIALRGLCLTDGSRLDVAREVLSSWADAVSQGMVPNRFPDAGEAPEYNAVDASLWFVVAAGELMGALAARHRALPEEERRRLRRAIQQILDGYREGTRYRIRMDADGLLAAGEPGVQLTWMDAKVGDDVITPRIGKPVEVQALWVNALAVGAAADARYGDLKRRAEASFGARFWNPEKGCLHDVVDVDHVPGTADPTFRPNQILAVGGLPTPLLTGARARAVVDAVEAKLWTPLGLRSLSPEHEAYVPRYQGGVRERDGAYHQGTVWPWLLGPFLEAWLRVHGDDAERRSAARRRFLDPLLHHLSEAGLGHISEIVDAEPPHTPRGAPFQAWSLAEALRIRRRLDSPIPPKPAAPSRDGERA
jgi:predicted glycogen debranching enzyme